MTDPILRTVVYAIEGYSGNSDLQIVSFNQRKNGDYEIVVRDTTKKVEVENENDKQA